ncbi:hypothetical protein AB0O07_13690 [Streptomyces sp. NPDC093085]|uniref:hypothetical protein n=1 Tax=Streptomyces sp. NPDC093085 TaxID=3155068 RepID=UPI00341642BD
MAFTLPADRGGTLAAAGAEPVDPPYRSGRITGTAVITGTAEIAEIAGFAYVAEITGPANPARSRPPALEERTVWGYPARPADPVRPAGPC